MQINVWSYKINKNILTNGQSYEINKNIQSLRSSWFQNVGSTNPPVVLKKYRLDTNKIQIDMN